jgi:hypothetical protein
MEPSLQESRKTQLRIWLLRSTAYFSIDLSSRGVFEKTYEKLHFRNLLVNLFHEFDDEVDQLVF